MRALVLDGQLRLDADAPMPQPQGDQALLKIRKAGICRTDLELIGGYMNFSGVLGHEFVAEVVDGSDEWLGKRVVGEINVACGECDFLPARYTEPVSQSHDRRYRPSSRRICRLPCAHDFRNLFAVPDNVPDDAAVFAEPLAAALQIFEAQQISPRDRVLK
ncbi:MAG: alcohol dehydrogenase catalytic domain-containing protein [Anaerolineae bacterium]